MNNKFLLPLAVIGSLLAGTSAHSATVISAVDPLTQSQQSTLIAGTLTPAPNVLVNGGLLSGTTRTLTLEVIADNGNFSVARVPASGLTPGFSLSNDVEQNTDAILDYGTFDPINFTVNGADRFLVNVTSNDLVTNAATLIVNGVTFSGNPPVAPNLPATLELPFSAFPGVDFTQVTSLVLELNPFNEGDMALSFFAVGADIQPPTGTPEPTTMLGLLAVGAMGFASRRRQK
jgi:hypothetical protein